MQKYLDEFQENSFLRYLYQKEISSQQLTKPRLNHKSCKVPLIHRANSFYPEKLKRFDLES